MIPAAVIARVAAAIMLLVVTAGAAAAQPSAEGAPLDGGDRYVFSTFALIIGGAGAFLAVAGMALRQSGSVAARHRASAMIKAASVAALSFVAFWIAGASLAFHIEPGGLLGSMLPAPPPEDGTLEADHRARLFFHASLAMVAAVIAIGAVVDRVRHWPFCLFAGFFAVVTLPIVMSWVWGGGYLAATWAFADLGGGAVIHVAAGAAALAASLVVGSRQASARDARSLSEPDTTGVPLAGVGGFVAAVGLLGVMIGASGPVQSTEDAAGLGRIALNAALASAAALATTTAMTQIIYRKIDASAVLGAMTGAMAALSAAPAAPAQWQAALIGAIAGVLVTLGAPALERAGIEDTTGSAPAHLFCGAWGVLILPWTQEGATMLGQIAGLFIIAAFAFAMSALPLIVLRYTIGLRVGPDVEQSGGDQALLTTAAHRDARLR